MSNYKKKPSLQLLTSRIEEIIDASLTLVDTTTTNLGGASDLMSLLRRTTNFITQGFSSPTAFNYCHFYIIAKIHKSPLVGRPICSNLNYVTYFASKFVDQILRPFIVATKTYISDSTDLLRKLSHATFPQDCLLSSADVTNMYPSIPISEGIQDVIRVTERMKHLMLEETLTLLPLALSLLPFVLNNIIIEQEGKFFKQIRGCAMGTPVAVVFAVLVFEEHQFKVLTQLDRINAPRPLTLYQFIDDTFLTFCCHNAKTH